MAKKLNSTQINKLTKSYTETKRVFIDEDEEFYVDIKPNFKPTEVQDVIESFFNVIGSLNTKELDIDVPKAKDIEKINIKDNVFFLLLDAHAINHFSNLNIPDKDSYKYVQTLLSLINLPDEGFSKLLNAIDSKEWTNLVIKYFKYQLAVAQTVETVEKLKEEKAKTKQPLNVLSNEKVEQVIQEATEAVESNDDSK